MSKKGTKKIPEWKKEEVKDIIRLVNKYPILGVVDMENLPSLQLQRIKQKLGSMIELKMSRRRLIKRALEGIKDKPNMDKVIESMRGMPAILFTKENPFKIYKTLAKNKSQAPAKPGQTAPNDIIIPAGPTQFTPGPIISELAQQGIKTKVENGKLAVISDVTLVKEGGKITPAQADLLTRFGIEPMEVGMNIVIIYENGIIYDKSILAVDEEAYIQNIRTASADSIALSMEIGYITPDNVITMIQKAHRDTKALAESTDILTDEKVGQMVGQADVEMKAIKAVANIVEEIVGEEKKKEHPKEEAKEEPKKEVKEEPKEEKKEEFKEDFPTEKGPTTEEVLKEVEQEEEKAKKEAEDKKAAEDAAKKIMKGGKA
ncbi:MAG: 50S ribosomal protein L10 [Nanoarchaeota archaeon]|nr:50S ribosomal protein L10 [Nanoarchaeota archaeon]MCG2718560.1 50S ribosomal protein L10 [Nanoarchaeota archaeon]